MKRSLLLAMILGLLGVAEAHARSGSLGGTVLDVNGNPVAHARVTVQYSDGRHPHARAADSHGHFLFRNLQPGLYDLRAYAKGKWSDWLHNQAVRAGRRTTVTLRLLADPPAQPDPEELHGRVREWTIPVAEALPHDPAVDPQGNIWMTLMRANQLARLNPLTGEWKLYPAPTPNSGPHGLVSDANGNIWFTENFVGKIGRVDAQTGQVTEYKAPTAKDPHTPIFGPDGMLWFTAQSSNLIIRMDTKTGEMREFRVPTPRARPYGIAVGPDGALWFCEFSADRLGRIEPNAGAITEYETPLADAQPRRLVVVGDAIYFTDFHGGRLGRFDLKGKGFRFWPSPSGRNSGPYGIAADAGGNIWYAEFNSNQLVRFQPSTETFTRFNLPSPRSEVRNMARDAQGRIWMALSGADKVAAVE